MNRENVNEHYRSETNELLTQMENFRGILVCATNFTESLDPAVMNNEINKLGFWAGEIKLADWFYYDVNNVLNESVNVRLWGVGYA